MNDAVCDSSSPALTGGQSAHTEERGTCGFVPFPNYGAYGHWACERPRRHMGRHRFVNYTWPRIPRVWRLRRLWRAFQADRRIRSLTKSKRGYGYRRTLFPARYEPPLSGSSRMDGETPNA